MTTLSLFATFYITAQIIERAVELFSEFGFLGKEKKTIEVNRRKIASLQKMLDKKIESGASVGDPAIEDIEEKITQLENEKGALESRRIIFLGALASVIGVALCWLAEIGFFKTVGVAESIAWWDKILSGILVGSGTKPLHDLIARIEKATKA
ncbi:MAG: hypothetical protein QME59_04335 [Candidatus Hydrothermarchaeota archaeon]|nr:hypothetical protein [Candidatus Hydrothermarchaeota archaeon]